MTSELVGWQFRYVFEDQGDRRSDWSTVLDGERGMKNNYRPYDGSKQGKDTVRYEVRDVWAGPVGGGAIHSPGVGGSGGGKEDGAEGVRAAQAPSGDCVAIGGLKGRTVAYVVYAGSENGTASVQFFFNDGTGFVISASGKMDVLNFHPVEQIPGSLADGVKTCRAIEDCPHPQDCGKAGGCERNDAARGVSGTVHQVSCAQTPMEDTSSGKTVGEG